jgi:hypothetical protein
LLSFSGKSQTFSRPDIPAILPYLMKNLFHSKEI